jgi:hypothetical protein
MRITFRCDPALLDLLPRPQPARAALPDWLRAMAPRVPSEMHGRPIRTLKQCPPFVDAMSHGFMIFLPCDVVVQNGQFSWRWSLPELSLHNHPKAPLSFHVPEQLLGSPLAQGTRGAQGKQVAIKFNSFWTIELEPGYSLMVMHPVNRDDLPFRTVTGLVDADQFHGVGINFPAVWTQPEFSGTLPRGTPVAQCFAARREINELQCEAMSAAQQQSYDTLAEKILAGPGVYRKGYRVKRSG